MLLNFRRSGWKHQYYNFKQECIPVGCVPPAAVAVCWGVSASVHAGIHPPGLGLDTPPGVGLDSPPGVGLDTPWPDPPTSPLGLGLGLDTPPLWIEFLTHASENITLPQLRCGR